jgi:hypothetical protein
MEGAYVRQTDGTFNDHDLSIPLLKLLPKWVHLQCHLLQDKQLKQHDDSLLNESEKYFVRFRCRLQMIIPHARTGEIWQYQRP